VQLFYHHKSVLWGYTLCCMCCIV